MRNRETALTIPPTAADYARANRAPNTLRAYRAAWRAFAAWCAEHNFPALPAGHILVHPGVVIGCITAPDSACITGRPPAV